MIPTKQLRPHRFLTLRLFLSNLCGLLLAILLLNNTANSATVDPDLLFLGDFETGNIQSPASNHDGWTAQSCYSYNFDVVTSPVRAGKYACKIYLKKNASVCFPNGRVRAQLVKDTSGSMNLDVQVGRWFGFSVYYPDDWPATNYMSIMSVFGNLYQKVETNDTEIVSVRWGTGPGQDRL